MKAEEIYEEILKQISRGVWIAGQQLPTERALAERYGVSRPTISRVLNRLRDSGHLKRVVGAGTFLTEAAKLALAPARQSIGLFVPGLGRGEIFEPICARIAELSTRHDVTLIWGSLPSGPLTGGAGDADRLMRAAERLVVQGVSGVFFQPEERENGLERQNRRIAELFASVGVKLVLLDSDFMTFPDRSPYDLVGIDNVAAGYKLCQHFLAQGQRRVDFLWPPFTAGTYAQRLMGYREALYSAGVSPNPTWEHEGVPSIPDFIAGLLDQGARNIICVNDETASQVMHSLEALGYKVPDDVRIAGFDDVKYAHLLRVPLTTIRQPCREIAEIALKTMIDRINQPELPPASILLKGDLCVRRSSLVPVPAGGAGQQTVHASPPD